VKDPTDFGTNCDERESSSALKHAKLKIHPNFPVVHVV